VAEQSSGAKKKVAVVGAGPGGYAAAFMAADLGLEVTMIGSDVNPGGVCLYVGCIPSKALLHVAELINEADHAAAWGVAFAKPKVDVDKLRAFKTSVVSKLTGGLGQLAKQRKVTYIQGKASLADANTVSIAKAAGGEEKIRFDNIILATGSRPATLPVFDIKSARVMDSTGALDLTDVPKTLLVVGGGYIGLELGTVYAALGTKVSVVEVLSGLLPGADRDLVTPLAKRIEKVFDKVMLNTKVTQIKEEKTGIRVKFEGEAAGEQVYDKILVSVGRKPNTEIEGLEKTKVTKDKRGFIEVDEQRRTKEAAIFAIGDIAGEPMLAHKAMHEGRVAAEVIAGKRVAFEPQAIPAVVFTDPEIAWAGLTETQAQAEGREVKVVRYPWAASGRAVSMDRTDGVTKLIIDPKTDRILGMGITGTRAGEMIAEGVHAIEMAATAADLGLTIHPHPTLSETLMEAADSYYGTATDIYRPKK